MFKKYVTFLFKPVDARVYSLFRITFALAVLFNFIDLAGYRMELFSEQGMIDASTVIRLSAAQPYHSIFHFVQSPAAVNLVFIVSGTAIFFMAVGLFTRISILIVYLWQLSYLHFIFPVLSGWDFILTTYSFLLLISPRADSWSVDGWLKQKYLKIENPATVPAYGLYLMRFQLVIIYLSTVGLKLYDSYWQSGEFVSYFMLSVYSRFPHPAFAGYVLLSKILTYGTLIVESCVPFLLLSRKHKKIAFLLGYPLHIGIMAVSNLFLFSFVMLTLYLPFLNNVDEIPKMVGWHKLKKLRAGLRERVLGRHWNGKLADRKSSKGATLGDLA